MWKGKVYISTSILVKVTKAGDVEVEGARDLLSIGEDGVDVVVGTHDCMEMHVNLSIIAGSGSSTQKYYTSPNPNDSIYGGLNFQLLILVIHDDELGYLHVNKDHCKLFYVLLVYYCKKMGCHPTGSTLCPIHPFLALIQTSRW